MKTLPAAGLKQTCDEKSFAGAARIGCACDVKKRTLGDDYNLTFISMITCELASARK